MGNDVSVDKLVTDNINLVHHVIHKYFHIKPGNDDAYDEAFQDGCLGLVKAARQFKPELGNAFSTYAVYLILNGIKKGYKKEQFRGLHMNDRGASITPENAPIIVSIEQTNSDEQTFELPLGIVDNDHDGIYADDLMATLEEIIPQEFHGRDLSIILEYLYSISILDERPTQEWMAKKYEIAQPSVGRILGRFKKTLQLKGIQFR